MVSSKTLFIHVGQASDTWIIQQIEDAVLHTFSFEISHEICDVEKAKKRELGDKMIFEIMLVNRRYNETYMYLRATWSSPNKKTIMVNITTIGKTSLNELVYALINNFGFKNVKWI